MNLTTIILLSFPTMAVLAIPFGHYRLAYERKMYEAGLLNKKQLFFEPHEYKAKMVDDQSWAWAALLIGFTIYPISIVFGCTCIVFESASKIGNNIADKKIKAHKEQQEIEADAREAKFAIEEEKELIKQQNH